MTVGAHHRAGVKIHTSRSMAFTIDTSRSESLFWPRSYRISGTLTSVGDGTLAVIGGTLTIDGCTLTVGSDTSMIDGCTLAVGGGTLTVDCGTMTSAGGT
jgi:hypothetical protein